MCKRTHEAPANKFCLFRVVPLGGVRCVVVLPSRFCELVAERRVAVLLRVGLCCSTFPPLRFPDAAATAAAAAAAAETDKARSSIPRHRPARRGCGRDVHRPVRVVKACDTIHSFPPPTLARSEKLRGRFLPRVSVGVLAVPRECLPGQLRQSRRAY